MKIQTGHTPTPWQSWKNDSGIYGFGNPKSPSGRAFNEVDANFIIRAVNSHDELLEACKGLLLILDGSDIAHFNDGNILQAKEAIKKAEGK